MVLFVALVISVALYAYFDKTKTEQAIPDMTTFGATTPSMTTPGITIGVATPSFITTPSSIITAPSELSSSFNTPRVTTGPSSAPTQTVTPVPEYTSTPAPTTIYTPPPTTSPPLPSYPSFKDVPKSLATNIVFSQKTIDSAVLQAMSDQPKLSVNQNKYYTMLNAGCENSSASCRNRTDFLLRRKNPDGVNTKVFGFSDTLYAEWMSEGWSDPELRKKVAVELLLEDFFANILNKYPNGFTCSEISGC